MGLSGNLSCPKKKKFRSPIISRQLFLQLNWPIGGAHRAANHKRMLLSSTNRGLATIDCSLQLWEGEAGTVIRYSPSILLLALLDLAAGRFSQQQ